MERPARTPAPPWPKMKRGQMEDKGLKRPRKALAPTLYHLRNRQTIRNMRTRYRDFCFAYSAFSAVIKPSVSIHVHPPFAALLRRASPGLKAGFINGMRTVFPHRKLKTGNRKKIPANGGFSIGASSWLNAPTQLGVRQRSRKGLGVLA